MSRHPDQSGGPPARGRLLSADEVAQRLDMTGRTVRRIPAGQLPYLVLQDRGHRRYDPADVDLFLRRLRRHG